jgi:transcriptional regulator with XRE-family HTH domain
MNNTVSKNIRKCRDLKGFSQEYMAEQMNLTQSAYAKIENTETKLTVDRLNEIYKILEIDIAKLLEQKTHNIYNIYNNEIGNIENINIENKELLKELLEAKNQLIDVLRKKRTKLKYKNTK